MADVTRLPGVFAQMRLIAELRYRMLKNSLRRKQNRWDLIGMIWVSFFSVCLVIGVGFAFYGGTYEFVVKDTFEWFALLYWVVFLWWQVFPMFVAGFGSNFEFATLLRFPLSLRAFYLLGLGYGFSDFGAISSICWILAMVAGAATAQPGLFPIVAVVSLVFVFMNVTLERLVGSWLEKLLAKRRSREIFLGIFIVSMVSLNFLNPAIQHWGRQARPAILQYIPYLSWLPGSLAGEAISAWANGNARGVALGVAGLLGWLAVLSALLWRRFAAQYAGEAISDAPSPTRLRKREEKRSMAGEARALLKPEVAAMVAKEFRYLMRNGFAFIGLVIPPLMVIFFTMQFGPGSMLKEHSVKPMLFFPGIMAYLMLILVSPAYNSFAYEGKGIQTYFMVPVQFRDVLLGKNLFLVAMVASELALALGLLIWRVGWPGTPMFLATVSGGAFAVTGQLAIANWSSLSFPKKMEVGRLKGQRNSGVAVWIAFGAQFLVGGICALILFAGGWNKNPWVAPVAFLALTVVAVGGYLSSLEPLNRLAEAKKELLIETLSK